MIATLISLGLAVGTFVIVWEAEYDCAMPSLKVPLWLIGFMHLVNCLETIINLTGCEKHLCSCLFGCIFFSFEITVLIYMQVVYFDARDCMRQTPLLYFWLFVLDFSLLCGRYLLGLLYISGNSVETQMKYTLTLLMMKKQSTIERRWLINIEQIKMLKLKK